jgi:hypothetical protein
MLAILVVLIVAVTIFVMFLLVIVAVGIRKEPSTEELSEHASSLVVAFVRRLLGLHVRRPNSPFNIDQGDRRLRLTRVTPLQDPMRKPNPNERWMSLFDARTRDTIRIERLGSGKPLGPNASDPSCWRR